jgi:hypothetical protein
MGEKVGSFLGGRRGCLYFDGLRGEDKDWFSLLTYLLIVSSPMFDLADGRGPQLARCVCSFLVV